MSFKVHFFFYKYHAVSSTGVNLTPKLLRYMFLEAVVPLSTVDGVGFFLMNALAANPAPVKAMYKWGGIFAWSLFKDLSALEYYG